MRTRTARNDIEPKAMKIMNEESRSEQTTVFCGIDVSAKTLAVAVQQEKESLSEREFANTSTGHKALIAWLHKRKALVRVCLEATGVYSLDLALALDQAEGIEVAVLNPKAVNRFAQTLRRSKTDKADAQALAEYSRRMPFKAWRGPSQRGLRLRTISRYISGLTGQYTRENNRLHAAQGSASTPRCILVDLRRLSMRSSGGWLECGRRPWRCCGRMRSHISSST